MVSLGIRIVLHCRIGVQKLRDEEEPVLWVDRLQFVRRPRHDGRLDDNSLLARQFLHGVVDCGAVQRPFRRPRRRDADEHHLGIRIHQREVFLIGRMLHVHAKHWLARS